MIRDNPLLGPEWEELGKAIVLILDATPTDDVFCVETYSHNHSLSPSTSPYFQGNKDEFGEFFIEIAANLVCEPKLTEEQFKMMEFLSWDLPYVTDEQPFGSLTSGSPNFERRFADDVPREVIAEAIIEALVVVYGFTDEEFFNFGGKRKTELIASNTNLGRLKTDKGNPLGQIFALPGKHLDMIPPGLA